MRLVGITGATGFVGQALRAAMVASHRDTRGFLRQPVPENPGPDVVVGDIGPGTDWRAALDGVDCVVHLAARTHVLHDKSDDPLAAYRRINVEGTRQLAQQAVIAGVRRFIFLSSIKVNGELTVGNPYTETDPPAPEDAYGITKCEAEGVLRDIASHASMELVILRPPLVYGPGVKGNFLRLLKLVGQGTPLPLASIKNLRSMIGVANLADAILTSVDAPAAAGKTYLVSDGEDVSTPELIIRLASAMGKTPHLLPCPPAMLKLGARLLGKQAVAMRLTGSLQVDSSRIRHELGWRPRCSLDQGLNATVQWYHQGQN